MLWHQSVEADELPETVHNSLPTETAVSAASEQLPHSEREEITDLALYELHALSTFVALGNVTSAWGALDDEGKSEYLAASDDAVRRNASVERLLGMLPSLDEKHGWWIRPAIQATTARIHAHAHHQAL